MIHGIILAAIGVFLISAALIINTENFRSAFFFKVIPFFCGMYLIMYVAMFMNHACT